MDKVRSVRFVVGEAFGRARLRPMPGIARGLIYDVAPSSQIARRTAIGVRRR
jgi:hypothetical protein